MRKSCCGVSSSDLGALRLMDIMLKHGVQIVSVNELTEDGHPKFSVFGIMEREDQGTQIVKEVCDCCANLKFMVSI